jgi:hypothetical protein
MLCTVHASSNGQLLGESVWPMTFNYLSVLWKPYILYSKIGSAGLNFVCVEIGSARLKAQWHVPRLIKRKLPLPGIWEEGVSILCAPPPSAHSWTVIGRFFQLNVFDMERPHSHTLHSARIEVGRGSRHALYYVPFNPLLICSIPFILKKGGF